ncbi:MAG: hypothetical protein IT289_07065 [Oligoflexia bacterium]|nr:hypothetical protein [Oligoflexia bacterium]
MIKATVLAVTAVFLTGSLGFGQVLQPPIPQATFRFRIQATSGNPSEVFAIARYLNKQGFDVSGYDVTVGQVEVVTGASGLSKIQELGLVGFLVTQELRPDSRYLNPDRLAEKLQGIQLTYPQITRIERIGTSNQGRPILALLVSGKAGHGRLMSKGRPSMIIDGLHHAREVMTPEVVIGMAETLLQGAQYSEGLQDVLNRWDFWFIPMLNPDGSQIVFTSNSMWRKNARSDERNSIHGVDVNRNYTFKWRACNGSSTSKWSETYSGAAAASEPETQALVQLAEKERPSVYLSYHSFSELVLYPYGCSGSFPAERLMVESLAKEVAAKLPRDSGGGSYIPGTPWQLLYDVDGDSMGHMSGTHGALAFTFEVNTEFQPPYELKAPTIAKHRGAFLHILHRADNNMLTIRVFDGATQAPLSARIQFDSIVPRNGELPFRTDVDGYFHKILMPGRYGVLIQTSDGRRAEKVIEMRGERQLLEISL